MFNPPRSGLRTYFHLVERLAVLEPFFADVGLHAELSRGVKQLTKWWHHQAKFLQECPAGGTDDRNYPRVLSSETKSRLACPPAFGMKSKSALPCNAVTLCPFCWARNAGRVWSLVDKKIFGPPETRATRSSRLADYELVMRSLRLQCPFDRSKPYGYVPEALVKSRLRTRDRQYDGWDHPLLTSLTPRRLEHLKFKRYGVLGGLDHSFVDLELGRDADGKPYPKCWLWVTKQFLLLLPRNMGNMRIIDEVLREVPEGWQQYPDIKPWLRTFDRPNRKMVAYAIGWLYKYPKFLLRGPHKYVVETLRARRGRRLVASFGCLRGSGCDED